jgi:hypothetical protein
VWGARPHRRAVAAAREAEGSLTPELRGRVASSPDNDATRGNCRIARARQARRTVCNESEPVIEPPQAMAPGSNPTDMGWASGAREPRGMAGNPVLGDDVVASLGACGEWPRDCHNRSAGEELGTDPAKRTAVNVGTRPVSPRFSREAGKAQRQLVALGGGIAFVVVRAGESPVHGEGRQWACSPTETRGGRR